MAPNTAVTMDDLVVKTVPANAMNVSNDFALSFNKDMKDHYVNSKVFANQFVYKKQLVTLDKTDPFDSMDLSQLRKISIPLSYVDGFAGNLEHGDKIDIAFVGQGKKKDASA